MSDAELKGLLLQLLAKMDEMLVVQRGHTTDIGGLKQDVGGLKQDVGELKAGQAQLQADVTEIKQVVGGNYLKTSGRIDQLSDQVLGLARKIA